MVLPRIYFNLAFPGPEITSESIVELNDSSYVIKGIKDYNSNFILQLNKTANITVKYTIEDTSSREFKINCIEKSNDNTFLIGGISTDIFRTNLSTIFLIKSNQNANEIWAKKYIISNYEKPDLVAIKYTNDSSCILLINDNSISEIYNDIVLLKINNEGEIVWNKKITTDIADRFIANNINVINDTSIIATAYNEISNNSLVIHFNTTDTNHWCKRVPNVRLDNLLVVNDSLIFAAIVNNKLGYVKTDMNVTNIFAKMSGSMNSKRAKIVKSNHLYYLNSLNEIYNISNVIQLDTSLNVVSASTIYNLSDMIINQKSKSLLLMNGPVYGLKTNAINLDHSGLISLDTSIMTTNYICYTNQAYIDTNSFNYASVNLNSIIDSVGSSFDFSYRKYGFILIENNECVSYIDNISNLELQNLISIYPNPTNGIFQLKNESEPINNVVFTVYDALGKVQFMNTFDLQETQSIDCSKLTSGMYYYQLRTNNQVIKQDKLIIVK